MSYFLNYVLKLFLLRMSNIQYVSYVPFGQYLYVYTTTGVLRRVSTLEHSPLPNSTADSHVIIRDTGRKLIPEINNVSTPMISISFTGKDNGVVYGDYYINPFNPDVFGILHVDPVFTYAELSSSAASYTTPDAAGISTVSSLYTSTALYVDGFGADISGGVRIHTGGISTISGKSVLLGGAVISGATQIYDGFSVMTGTITGIVNIAGEVSINAVGASVTTIGTGTGAVFIGNPSNETTIVNVSTNAVLTDTIRANTMYLDGDLLIRGSTVTISAQTLLVDDNVLELNMGEYKEGGGILYNVSTLSSFAGLMYDLPAAGQPYSTTGFAVTGLMPSTAVGTSTIDAIINSAGFVFTPQKSADFVIGNTASTLVDIYTQVANLSTLTNASITNISAAAATISSISGTNIATGTLGVTNANVASMSVNAASVSALSATTAGISALSATTAGISALSATTAGISALSATTAGVSALSATTAGISALSATTAGIGTLSATTAGVGTLEITAANVASLSVNAASVSVLSTTTAGISALSATTAGIGTLSATTAGINALSATTAGVSVLSATTAGVSALSATTAGISALSATTAGIYQLTATMLNVSSISSGSVNFTTSSFVYANISSLSVSAASMSTLNTIIITSALLNVSSISSGSINFTTSSFVYANISSLSVSVASISSMNANLAVINSFSVNLISASTINLNTLNVNTISAGLLTYAGSTFPSLSANSFSTNVANIVNLSGIAASFSTLTVSAVIVGSISTAVNGGSGSSTYTYLSDYTNATTYSPYNVVLYKGSQYYTTSTTVAVAPDSYGIFDEPVNEYLDNTTVTGQVVNSISYVIGIGSFSAGSASKTTLSGIPVFTTLTANRGNGFNPGYSVINIDYTIVQTGSSNLYFNFVTSAGSFEGHSGGFVDGNGGSSGSGTSGQTYVTGDIFRITRLTNGLVLSKALAASPTVFTSYYTVSIGVNTFANNIVYFGFTSNTIGISNIKVSTIFTDTFSSYANDSTLTGQGPTGYGITYANGLNSFAITTTSKSTISGIAAIYRSGASGNQGNSFNPGYTNVVIDYTMIGLSTSTTAFYFDFTTTAGALEGNTTGTGSFTGGTYATSLSTGTNFATGDIFRITRTATDITLYKALSESVTTFTQINKISLINGTTFANDVVGFGFVDSTLAVSKINVASYTPSNYWSLYKFIPCYPTVNLAAINASGGIPATVQAASNGRSGLFTLSSYSLGVSTTDANILYISTNSIISSSRIYVAVKNMPTGVPVYPFITSTGTGVCGVKFTNLSLTTAITTQTVSFSYLIIN